MKRVIKIVAIMLTLIVSMGAISGVALKVDDPILFNAVEITRKIFNTNLQNETWVKGYFTFRTLHVHDDTPVDANNHIVRCLECDRTKAVNGHIFDNLIIGTTTIPANPSYHLKECVCGFIEKQYHNYDTYVCIDSEKHVKSCACTYSMIESHDRKFIGICGIVG